MKKVDNQDMKVSVVIPTYNRPGLAAGLKKQINSISKAEVIVVDQTGSRTPNTSAAKNKGISSATGDIVIFFDDDVEVSQATIQAHIAEYNDPNVVGVAGRVINDGENIPNKTDVTSGQANKYLTNFVNNFWGTKRQIVVHPYGCNMSFRRSVLINLRGFDEQYPPPLCSFEEVDLGLRASKLGKIIFSPSAIVYHHKAKSGGTRTNPVTKNKLYYRSYGRLVKKHVILSDMPYSIFRLILRIIKEAPYALGDFFSGILS